MAYAALADLVLLLHLGFVAFVVLGGFLVYRRPRIAWLHVPAVLWGVLTEYAGIICPLTPLENRLRRLGGQEGFAGGFIDHYLTALLYPEGLTRRMQWALGTAALVINLVIYWRVVARHPRTRR
jgi:hypothetical protein